MTMLEQETMIRDETWNKTRLARFEHFAEH